MACFSYYACKAKGFSSITLLETCCLFAGRLKVLVTACSSAPKLRFRPCNLCVHLFYYYDNSCFVLKIPTLGYLHGIDDADIATFPPSLNDPPCFFVSRCLCSIAMY